jgi:hypothetical protein
MHTPALNVAKLRSLGFVHSCLIERPPINEVVLLRLEDGPETLGIWDGANWLANGIVVAAVEWELLERIEEERT